MEDTANYADAIILYLKDAAESLRSGLPVRAGLSSSCAADCLVRLSVFTLANKLYSKAAAIYWENAHSPLAGSVREWLWSLQKAYENFLLAGETSMAEAVYGEYVVLAKRIDPFIRDPKLPTPNSDSKTSGVTPTTTDLPETVVKAVNAFLNEQTVSPEATSREMAAESRKGYGE